ncbi:WD40/YVTN/BNR-like repeat-containing protein [Agarilytica rhodophyticola]|uniref:WD40/YVTN/BNR-like repeat-containing protein n=1 Tax=Agarilytica rhodophyticola TaxID=1737490 RepID=UPI000B346C7C|nr:hypothetical protein [Agarilytica rhodophyticola]
MKLFLNLTIPIVFTFCTSAFAAKESNTEKDDVFAALPLRAMGPAVTGGRISDLAVSAKNPAYYFAAVASGGVWRTKNNGTTWTPVFDGQGSYSIGDVTMDPNNSRVIWVGTGENNSQRSVGYGDGVYKSIDGGESWKNVGLKESEHIGEILVDPRNSNVVYVAAQGPLWRAGGDRGLYKTVDGGETWKRILDISPNTGVSDIAFEPGNPDVIYATSYQRRRHTWTLINGGPESSIYKTSDGGANWKKIDKGLPKVDLGRIGIAVAPTQPQTIYALVEASQDKSGFFISHDGGAHWKEQSKYKSGSPQYYQEIVVDPNNPLRVYSLDTFLMVSDDGGKNFRQAGEKWKHVDNHALWIDPDNSNHLIVGCDGGVYESWDRAVNWQFKANMPLTQFYKVSVDNDFPFYNVFGGTQDNASLGAAHRNTTTTGIRNSDWLYTQFGDGFKTQIDPTDPNIIYSQYQYGGLARYDKQSGERVQIKPVTPDSNEAQRWNWNSPLIISPHNNKRLYYASQRVFRSDDQGDSWQVVSGDLSGNVDRNTLPVMGRVWGVDAVAKNTSTSFYGSVIALSESPVTENLLYAGTDDGLIHYTTNGGGNWQKASWPKKVPQNSYVSDLEASVTDANTVFATFDNHKQGDFKPYIFRSNDRGKKWVDITGDLPQRGTVYTIAEDHVNSNLLFAGTEFGLFFSQNGGKNWTALKANLPTIAVRDMEIQRRESDLAIATFGRGFYILDDYSPLRTNVSQVKSRGATLFPVRRAFQFVAHSPMGISGQAFQGANYYAAKNPDYGAVFTYYLNEDLKTAKQKRQQAETELRKANKNIAYPSWQSLEVEEFEKAPELIFTIRDKQGNLVHRLKTAAKKGLHRLAWNLHYPGFEPVKLTKKTEFLPWETENKGPKVVPGSYTVTLSKLVNGVESPYGQSQDFEVVEIDNRTFASKDRTADLEFDIKMGRLSKAIQGAGKFQAELESRIQYIEAAIIETPKVDQNLLAKVRKLAESSTRIGWDLNGNRAIAKRAEPVPESISAYIAYLEWSRSENTGPVTGNQRLRFQRASEGYGKVYPKLKALAEQVTQLENALRDAQSPWIPGILPLEIN